MAIFLATVRLIFILELGRKAIMPGSQSHRKISVTRSGRKKRFAMFRILRAVAQERGF